MMYMYDIQCKYTRMHSTIKSKYLHRIRTFNIKLSKVYPPCMVCSFALSVFRIFHLVRFSLSAVDTLSTVSRAFFFFICLILMHSIQSQRAIEESKATTLRSSFPRPFAFVDWLFGWQMLLPCEMAFLNEQGEVRTIVG